MNRTSIHISRRVCVEFGRDLDEIYRDHNLRTKFQARLRYLCKKADEALAAAEAREKIRDHTVRVLAGCVQCRARERERAPRAGCSCGNCEVVRAALAVPPAQGPKEKP